MISPKTAPATGGRRGLLSSRAEDLQQPAADDGLLLDLFHSHLELTTMRFALVARECGGRRHYLQERYSTDRGNPCNDLSTHYGTRLS